MKGRKLISILLLFFISFNICSYVFVRAYYEGCKGYITENFCVNKNKPELHCNGQCHINKIISSKTKSADPLTITDNLLHTYLFSTFSTPEVKIEINTPTIAKHLYSYTNNYSGLKNVVDTPPPLS